MRIFSRFSLGLHIFRHNYLVITKFLQSALEILVSVHIFEMNISIGHYSSIFFTWLNNVLHNSIFLNIYFISKRYLDKLSQRNRDILATGSLYRWPQWPGQGQVETKNFIQVSHMDGRHLSTWAIFVIFCQVISRELVGNRAAGTQSVPIWMQMLQVAAFPSGTRPAHSHDILNLDIT